MSAKTVDSFEFCRRGEQASGTAPVAGFARLTAELANTSGELRWSVAGGQHATGLPQLSMTVQGEVQLLCQRCLTAFAHPVDSDTVLVLARNEAEADATEERLDDESIDVIVGSDALDLMVLVEDDALLALPLSAKHAVCPGDVPKASEDKPASPFAALGKLKS